MVFEMGAHHGVGNKRGEAGGRLEAVLDVVQRRGAHLEPLLVARVPFGDARVQVPAVVIESRGRRDALRLVDRQFLELAKPHHHVGHLHTGVVDVVLHFDGVAAELEDPHEGVAERRIPEMPDVRGFVGVNGGVLDDGFFRVRRRRRQPAREAEPRQQKAGPVEEHVEIPVGRRFDPRHARNGSERGRQLLGNHARRFAQPAGQIERDRRAEVAERAIGRVLDGDDEIGIGDAVQPGEHGPHTRPDLFMQRKNHAAVR